MTAEFRVSGFVSTAKGLLSDQPPIVSAVLAFQNADRQSPGFAAAEVTGAGVYHQVLRFSVGADGL